MSPFRKYRTDADPSPFMGAIRSMSFSADAMTKQRNTIQRMSRRTPDGEVTLMRAGGIDYIDIVPIGVTKIYYVVFYRTKDFELRIKLLGKEKNEIKDYPHADVYRILGGYSTTYQWKIGNLILDEWHRFYNIDTGLFLYSFPVGYALVEGDYVYTANDYSLKKIKPIRQDDGSYEFEETTFTFAGSVFLEEGQFYFTAQIEGDGGFYYWTVGVVNKETGAYSLKDGYIHPATPENEWRESSYLYNYTPTVSKRALFTFGGSGVGNSVEEIVTLPGHVLDYNEGPPDVFYEIGAWYNHEKGGRSLYAGTLYPFGNLYDHPINTPIWDYSGADSEGRGAYPAANWYNIEGNNLYINETYVLWNGGRITLQELYELFSLPADTSQLVSLMYAPGLEKNPEVAALLR